MGLCCKNSTGESMSSLGQTQAQPTLSPDLRPSPSTGWSNSTMYAPGTIFESFFVWDFNEWISTAAEASDREVAATMVATKYFMFWCEWNERLVERGEGIVKEL